MLRKRFGWYQAERLAFGGLRVQVSQDLTSSCICSHQNDELLHATSRTVQTDPPRGGMVNVQYLESQGTLGDIQMVINIEEPVGPEVMV